MENFKCYFLTHTKEKVKGFLQDPYLVAGPGGQLLLPCLFFC